MPNHGKNCHARKTQVPCMAQHATLCRGGKRHRPWLHAVHLQKKKVHVAITCNGSAIGISKTMPLATPKTRRQVAITCKMKKTCMCNGDNRRRDASNMHSTTGHLVPWWHAARAVVACNGISKTEKTIDITCNGYASAKANQ